MRASVADHLDGCECCGDVGCGHHGQRETQGQPGPRRSCGNEGSLRSTCPHVPVAIRRWGGHRELSAAAGRPHGGVRPEHEDEQFVVFDLVDDAVVAGADPPLARAADESGRSWWSRFDGQQIERGLEPSADLGVVFAQLAGRSRGQRDAVAHVRPRSALTCSHGIGASPVARISSRASSAARISAMSSASARIRSRSSASMTAATRRPRRAR